MLNWRARLWIWVRSDMEVLCGCSYILGGDSKLSWWPLSWSLASDQVSVQSSFHFYFFSVWETFINSHLSVCSLHSRQCKPNPFYLRDSTFQMIGIDERALKMFIQSSSKTLIAEMQTRVKRRHCLTVQQNQVNVRYKAKEYMNGGL